LRLIMGLRSMLVFLDGDAQCDARVELALRLAAAHDAHLVGLAPTGALDVVPAMAAVASHAVDEVSAARAAAIETADQRVQHFLERCRAHGLSGAEAGVHEGDKAAVLLHEAQCTDLAIIGQADPASLHHREVKRFVEQVLLRNARPTLVAPRSGGADTIGETVLVAWDDSRGAARAVADALPVLRRARAVLLRVWRRHGEAPVAQIRERMESVQRWLERQGVAVDLRIEATDSPIGDAILRAAVDAGADLIVMGTYGHSPWSERIVGGVTRTALATTTLPLFMSH
jgi:nucleotide-binding universal stress UspA family protein